MAALWYGLLRYLRGKQVLPVKEVNPVEQPSKPRRTLQFLYHRTSDAFVTVLIRAFEKEAASKAIALDVEKLGNANWNTHRDLLGSQERVI